MFKTLLMPQNLITGGSFAVMVMICVPDIPVPCRGWTTRAWQKNIFTVQRKKLSGPEWLLEESWEISYAFAKAVTFWIVIGQLKDSERAPCLR